MPLASQSLGYLNRASLFRKQLDHQVINPSRRCLLAFAQTRRPEAAGEAKRFALESSHLSTCARGHRSDSSATARYLTEYPRNRNVRGSQSSNTTDEDLDLLPHLAVFDREVDSGRALPKIESDDLSTWALHFSNAQRSQGKDGILRVWSAMAQSKSLSKVRGPEAEWIWTTILEASLPSDRHLERVNKYAQWMVETHAAHWPHLYERVVLYCLQHRQYRRAFLWHMRLAALSRAPCIRYITGPHRNMYDLIMPHLYELGLSTLCSQWRETLLRHRDVPRPITASQPFLRFFMNYYPNKALCLEEQVVVGLVPSVSHQSKHESSLWEALSADHEQGKGGKGLRFNDAIGARWFASSWVPLDFAVHAVHGLGVRVLGPMSLQSIALREKTAASILSRLRQLQNLNLSIGHSTYALAVRSFAERGDDDMLSMLLESDIHPEVFDDLETQQRIRCAARNDGDWQTYNLLLAIQPAVARDSIETTSNHLLQEHLKQQHNQRAIALLDDMRAMDVSVTHATMQVVHEHLVRGLPRHRSSLPGSGRQISEILAIATRLATRRKFLSSAFWEKALFRLGETGRLDDLERLASGIVRHYQLHASDTKGLISIHRSDSPMTAPDDASLDIPADLPLAHDWHPIRRIFVNRVLQAAIIRWGFRNGLNKPQGSLQSHNTEVTVSKFWIARGVRLLRVLRDQGIPIEAALVRAEVLHCIARYCIRSHNDAGTDGAEETDLATIRKLFNQAYGGPLLPEPLELRDLVNQAERQLPDNTKTFKSIPGWDRKRRAKPFIM
ncbi:hypothetical protein EV126DRAFT_431345 [Verticillium dahliae]|nr:hypothetical protein EV126DRAFT_431345 [Verticillium dahliae]